MKKRLIKAVVIETILLIVLIKISLSLYFDHQETVIIIEDISRSIKLFLTDIYISVISFIKDVKNEYTSIDSVFSKRELAILTWLLIIIAYLILVKKTRRHVLAVTKAFTDRKLMKIWRGVAIFTWVIVLLLIRLNFWTVEHFKDTILWYITVGLITTYRAFNKIQDIGYIKQVIIESLKFTVLIEFIGNLYSFEYWVEFVLWPIIVFLYFMISAIETQNEKENMSLFKLNDIIHIIIGIIGLVILYHSMKVSIENRHGTDFISLIKEIVLPIILSISLVFYNYLWVLRANYESVKIMLSSKKTIEDRFRWYLSIRIKTTCWLSISKTKKFVRCSQIMTHRISAYRDVESTMKRFKSNYRLLLNKEKSKMKDSLSES